MAPIQPLCHQQTIIIIIIIIMSKTKVSKKVAAKKVAATKPVNKKPVAKKATTKKPATKKATTKKATTKKAKPSNVVAIKPAKYKKGDLVAFIGWDGPEPDYDEEDDKLEVGMIGSVREVGEGGIETSFEINGNTTIVELIATEVEHSKAEAEADADADADEGGYEDLTVAELRADCVERGLAKGGSKAKLIDRLTEDDEIGEEEDAADEAEEIVKPKIVKPKKEKSLGNRADNEDAKAIKELTKRAKKVGLDTEDADNGETWTQFERTLKASEAEAALPKLKVTKSVATEISNDSDDAIVAAKRLIETAEKTYYTLGGVLAVISRDKLYAQVKVNGEFPYAGNKGFEAFCEDHLNVRYRKAQYLINIYESFTQAGLTEAKIGSIGWSKAKELVSILAVEPQNADKWIETAKEGSTAEVAEAVKARLTKIGAKTHGNTKTVRTVTCKFKLHEDEGQVVEQAIKLAKEQADTDDDSQAFAHIIKEWLLFQS